MPFPNCFTSFRQFCMELNGLAVKLQNECHPDSCTQMTATDQWIFLCAAHKTPKECPVIDYTRHTLDGAACLLNSNKYFPSRYDTKVTRFIYLYVKFSFHTGSVLKNLQLQNWDQYAGVCTEYFLMLTITTEISLMNLR